MIIRGGNDYYDCGLSLGIDPSIMLLRYKERDLEGVEVKARTLKFTGKSSYLTLQSVVVILADKLYRGAIITDNFPAGRIIPVANRTHYFWSAEKLKAWLAFRKDVGVKVETSWLERERFGLKEYFTVEPVSADVREYMIANRIAILTAFMSYREKPVFHVNPYNLKTLGFAKALDPYTAFQELSMWIGGVLGGSSPETIAITDDKVLAESHGFDKYSFRSQKREQS